MTKGVRAQEQEAKWPSLSEKERNRRWGRVKEMMRGQGLDCLVVFGLKSREQLARYLTNDRTGGITIFPLEGEVVQLTPFVYEIAAHLESTLRGEASWVNCMRLGGTGSKIVEVLREKGYDRANIGVVGLETYGPGEREGYVPYKTWACILDNLPHANFREVSAAFYKLVFIKSDEELQLVRKAAELGELAAEAMIKITHPGESESKIYAAVMNELFRNGGSGGVCRVSGDMILQSGPDNPGWGAPTWIFRGQPPRILKRGDVVQAEIFSVYGGMEAQLQMSVAIEPVDSVNRDCGAVAHHAYEVGLKALVPGKTFGEVVKEMEEPLRQAGAWYLTPLIHSLNPLRWISSTGVGIENLPGIERYEGIAPTPVIGGELVIQPGTTWELEPNACLGKHRVNVGGTVIVTEEGAIGLNVLPTEMHVIV